MCTTNTVTFIITFMIIICWWRTSSNFVVLKLSFFFWNFPISHKLCLNMNLNSRRLREINKFGHVVSSHDDAAADNDGDIIILIICTQDIQRHTEQNDRDLEINFPSFTIQLHMSYVSIFRDDFCLILFFIISYLIFFLPFFVHSERTICVCVCGGKKYHAEMCLALFSCVWYMKATFFTIYHVKWDDKHY
jgi:hypothetical protein